MAITFTGTIATDRMNIVNNDIAFVIDNTKRSRKKINVLRLIAQMENLDLGNGTGFYMAMLKTYKVTGISSGGIILTKNSFDTQDSSDDGIIVRSRILGDSPNMDIAVTGTPTFLWQQFTSRKTTAVEQHTTWDFSLIPNIPSPSPVLYPGECLFVRMAQGSSTGTQSPGGLFFIEGVFEEEDFDAGYTLSGTVANSSVPVVGAKVVLVTDLDADLPDPSIEVINSDASGNWSKILASDVKASAFVQHQNGGTMYTDEGKPYLEKP